ncbi:MAG: carboxylesterase family protein [Terriglobia bacterium]|nr:MAG: carboxylesterase family protein [Terriglobia bacterium]
MSRSSPGTSTLESNNTRKEHTLKPALKSTLVLVLLAVCGAVAWAAGANPVVGVTGGQIAGRLIPPGGAAFKGIPYAQPPLGTLRWHDPVRVSPWKGVRDAGSFGASCTQQISTWNSQEAQGNQEDCLYLNVWTSEWPAKSPKPVMLWLHGGGNTGGAASVDYFDGTSLSRRGVVLVTINYRLGLFGFFAHPGLTAESPHHSSGNYGLLDQIAALQWVDANIAKFGGDAKNVTVFGQSAGAVDTGYLLASPLSKGLVHRAIQESGPPIRGAAPLAQAEQLGSNFAAAMKAPAGGIDAVKFLRSLPAAELQKAAVAARGESGPPMGPLLDGHVLPASAALIFATGHQLPVPLIIGNNAREQGGPNSQEALKKAIAGNFGADASKAEEFYGVANGGNGKDDPLYGPAAIQFSADTRYRCGAVAEAIWHSDRKLPVYEYQFDPAIAGRPATQHSAELPFVFGNLLPGGFLGGPFGEAHRKISNDIQEYWTNFAKNGDPNGGSLPAWPKFDAAARAYLEFTDNGPVAKEGLRRAICDLYIDALKQDLASR